MSLAEGKCDLKFSIGEGEGGLEEVGVVEGEEHLGVDGLEDMQVDGGGELHRHPIFEKLLGCAEERELHRAIV